MERKKQQKRCIHGQFSGVLVVRHGNVNLCRFAKYGKLHKGSKCTECEKKDRCRLVRVMKGAQWLH